MQQSVRNRRKELRQELRADFKDMNTQLGVVHERFGEDGLDAMLTPSRDKSKNASYQYSAEA